jgi:hypothetical protein
MRYFKLFESFVNENLNEVKLSDYSLESPTSPKYDSFIAAEVGTEIIKAFENQGFKSLNSQPVKRAMYRKIYETFEFKKNVDGADYVFGCFIAAGSGAMNITFSYYINYTEPDGLIVHELNIPGFTGSRGNNAVAIGIQKMSKLTNGELVNQINELLPSVVKNTASFLEDAIKNYEVPKRQMINVIMTEGLLDKSYKYSE